MSVPLTATRAAHRATIAVVVAVLALLAAGTIVAEHLGPHQAGRLDINGLASQQGTRSSGPVQFAVTDLAGREVRSRDLVGRSVVLVFFSSTCGPCVAEAPTVRRLALAYRGKVPFVAVAAGDSAAAARAFARRHGWSGPIVPDTDYRLARTLHVLGTPTTVVLDDRGRVASTLYGALTEAALKSALRQIHG